ncbi:MAG: putative ParB-like nuclease [Rickettsiaceae bacterium]|jgi:hypothetical protein|nr:putative ParB-like nuclease [Rickettsiaceae bacterium]
MDVSRPFFKCYSIEIYKKLNQNLFVYVKLTFVVYYKDNLILLKPMKSLFGILRLPLFIAILALAPLANALNIDTIFIKEEKMSLEGTAVKAEDVDQPKTAQVQNKLNNNYSAGDRVFVNIEWLKPTQLRKSSINVANKLARSKGIIFDDGKSMLSLSDAVPVFKGFDGYLYLIDGHHNVLASIESKAKTIPVLIHDDLSDLNEDKFWEVAIAKNYAYLKDSNGEVKSPPKSFHDLVEDPLIYFAAISAFKCTPGQILTQQDYNKSLEHPLWLKVSNSVPFIEFSIANELHKSNFQFANQDRLNKDKLNSKIEEARKLLTNFSLEGLVLLPHDIEEAKKLYKLHCEQAQSSVDTISSQE